jgi:hypothetical protein
VLLFGSETEAVVLELRARLALPDSAQAFEVAFQPLEKFFVAIFWLKIIGVEIL